MNRTHDAAPQVNLDALSRMANKLRRLSVEMTSAAGSGHPTSALSCAELMAALFFHQMRWDPADPQARDVDRFVLSKGHAAPILWAALSEAGAIQEPLNTLRRAGSTLEGHPTPSNPWVRVATGSLGQGLAASAGMALANRLDGIDAHVFCLLGDGECSEGSVWEAAQFAALKGLARLVAIVDVNGLGQTGATPYGTDTAVYARRFEAFGWHSIEIDGHDIGAVVTALDQASKTGPTAIIARTAKGKGISFLENDPGWHGKAIKPDDVARALNDVGAEAITLRVEPRRVGARMVEGNGGSTQLPRYDLGDQVATRKAFGEALRSLGAANPRLVVLDGDVANSTYTELFAQRFPERFFQGFIAEQNMIGVGLGLATSGYIPCAATFACFLTRAYDFVRMAAHSRVPRLIVNGSHAGVSIGQDGPSQMGLEDLAMFRALAHSTVLYPSDGVSAAQLAETALHTDGIVYVRTTRGKTSVIYDAHERFLVGGSKVVRRSEHDRLTLIGAGITLHECISAADALAARGFAVRVIDAYSIKPLDITTLEEAARDTGRLLVVEDHWYEGGLGEAVAAAICPRAEVHRLAVQGIPHSATPEELLEEHGIGRKAITRRACQLLGVGCE